MSENVKFMLIPGPGGDYPVYVEDGPLVSAEEYDKVTTECATLTRQLAEAREWEKKWRDRYEQLGGEMLALRSSLTAATERAEKAERERESLLVALGAMGCVLFFVVLALVLS